MKNELIVQFEIDRLSSKLDKYARKILNDSNFQFETYEDKYIGDKFITIQTNKEMWNNDYFLEQITLLNANFSKERLIHCLELREHIDGIKFRRSNKRIYAMITLALTIVIVAGYYISQNLSKENQIKDKNVTRTTIN